MDNEPTHVDLEDLRADGDTVKMDDHRELRLRIEVDQDATINDDEADGKVEWVRGDRDWSPMRYPRPNGFDGSARIIDHDNGYALWWQPYEGLTDEQIRSERPRILDLVRYGFKGVILELLETIVDSQGGSHTVVVDTASLWGIDSLENGYLLEVVQELAAELL